MVARVNPRLGPARERASPLQRQCRAAASAADMGSRCALSKSAAGWWKPGATAMSQSSTGGGGSARDLLCGPHPPLSEAVAQEYATHGVRLTAVYSNCSGKHAGMLALARHHDWPTQFYTRLEHPVQQRCLAEVSRWTDVPAGAIKTAVDGCGVVCFGLPLRNMALAYARLGNAEFGMRNAEFPGGRPDANDPAPQFRTPHSAFRIVEAILRHPDLIAGSGRPCTEMMRAHPGRVIAKVGAEGVYCAVLPREGLGVALKVAD